MKELRDKFLLWAEESTRNTFIALGVALATLVIIVFLVVILFEKVIEPILVILAFIVFLFHDKIYEMLKKPVQLTDDISQDTCMQFILEVMTELCSRIFILKPFGIDSLHFKVKQKSPFFGFGFTAAMSGDSVFDDVSIAEIKHTLQERITERLYYGNANGIPYSIFGNSPSLIITDVKVGGNRYVYECVWVDNQAALDYVCSRANIGGGSATQIQANDDLF
jgi:hypothetical protein